MTASPTLRTCTFGSPFLLGQAPCFPHPSFSLFEASSQNQAPCPRGAEEDKLDPVRWCSSDIEEDNEDEIIVAGQELGG